MRFIEKNSKNEPKSLVEYRLTPKARYGGFAGKSDLKNALLDEQGHLCCYCMDRISEDKMKIEHWTPQCEDASNDLNYNNLLAACKGGEGNKEQHCDTAKGAQTITISPFNKSQMDQIRFSRDGRVSTNDENLNFEINNILKINNQNFCLERKSVMEGIQYKIEKESKKGTASEAYLSKLLVEWSTPRENKLKPYCQVGIYYLSKKLKIS